MRNGKVDPKKPSIQLTVAPENSSALAVSLQEAADMLGVHTNTVRREIWRGNLAAVRIGRILRVRVAELHAYLRRNEIRRPNVVE